MDKRLKKEPPEFEVIKAAVQGDTEAISQVVTYFQPFINARARRKYVDEYGQTQYAEDEQMKRRMEIKLITKILDFEIRP